MAKDFNADEPADCALAGGESGVLAHPFSATARERPPLVQLGLLALVVTAPAIGLAFAGGLTLQWLHWTGWALFFVSTVWRTALQIVSPSIVAAPGLPVAALPAYTVIAPLHREAAMVRRLADALCSLDYPRDRLQIILALEADDRETVAAARDLPPMFEVMIAPRGFPQTKPRACNLALARAIGEFVVVYDAEDKPHPGQLRQAVARFAVGGPKLACLQAPLRIAVQRGFLPRQFALEYAALFEVTLPALARLGAPFPLGGTSNHFRTRLLREVGGWDAYNVTEDADIGFRLAASGYELGMIAPPTQELPPTTLDAWIPQRARWLKGYMQTWSVHMRRPAAGGLGRLLMLQGSIGLAVLSAAAYGPLTSLVLAEALAAVCAGHWPQASLADAGVLGGAWAAAAASMRKGAHRAGERMRIVDALLAPAYWVLQSIAFARAVWQLVTRPFHWDKTPHEPAADEAAVFPCLDELARERVSRAA